MAKRFILNNKTILLNRPWRQDCEMSRLAYFLDKQLRDGDEVRITLLPPFTLR
jgi:hypothetical protein